MSGSLEGSIPEHGGLLKSKMRLDKCDQESWMLWYPGFRGLCGVKECKIPLQFDRDAPVGEAQAGPPYAHGLTLEAYDKQCDMLHNLLSVACTNNAEAFAILQLHMCTLDGLDDGLAAFKEIRDLCYGGAGMETIEGLLASTEAIDGSEFDTPRELAAHHNNIFTKVRDLTIRTKMDVKEFLDIVFKMQLLRCLRTGRFAEQYGNPLSITFSKKEIQYQELQQEIVRMSNVLNSTNGNGSQDNWGEREEAHYARNKHKNRDRERKCFRCGSRKHLMADCPYESSSDEDEPRPSLKKLGKPGPNSTTDKKTRKQKQDEEEDAVAHYGYGWGY